MTAFEQALAYTFKNEGGFANMKNDRGGPTNYGITIGTLSRWLGRKATLEDVKDLPIAVAKDIYMAWYWKPNNLDLVVSTAKAICIFDIGIVRGIEIGAKYAQEACNAYGHTLKVDGDLGPLSIQAINQTPTFEFVSAYSRRAEKGFCRIVASNPTQQKFLSGWVNRARRLKTLTLHVPEIA